MVFIIAVLIVNDNGIMNKLSQFHKTDSSFPCKILQGQNDSSWYGTELFGASKVHGFTKDNTSIEKFGAIMKTNILISYL